MQPLGFVGTVALGLLLLAAGSRGFIRVVDQKFVDEDCNEFLWVGANTWRLLEAEAGVYGNDSTASDTLMNQAQELNITVLRIFATGVTPQLPMKLDPNTYNDVALKALDRVMAKAAAHGLRVTLVPLTNWDGPDNKATFAAWSNLSNPDEFFTSQSAQADYQNLLRVLTQRVNTVTKVAYKNDPTILSWNLMNEPRYDANNTVCQQTAQQCATDMQDWIVETVAYLRAQDPNHLISIGSEGFYGPGNMANDNPSGSEWATATGQSFVANSQSKNIDYAEIHVWPDNWNVSAEFVQQWVTSHMQAARSLNMPLVVEEFGKNVTDHNALTIARVRNPVFETVFQMLNKSIATGDVLKGAQYWMWDPNLLGPASANWTNFGPDQVLTNETTVAEIIGPTAKFAAGSGARVPGCQPQAPAPAAATGAAGAATATAGRKLLHGD